MLQKSQRIDRVFLVLCFDRDGHSVPESHVHMVDGPAAQQLGAIDVCAVDEKAVRENELSLHGIKLEPPRSDFAIRKTVHRSHRALEGSLLPQLPGKKFRLLKIQANRERRWFERAISRWE
jgi:hypothetical protein